MQLQKGIKMKNNSLKFGYDLTLESGPVLRPSHLEIWASEKKSTSDQLHHEPTKYLTDALLGFAFYSVNDKANGNTANLCREYWGQIEPHLQIYKESQMRVQSLKQKTHFEHPKVVENFEKHMSSTLNEAFTETGVDFKELLNLLDCIQFLESESKSTILYNYSYPFSENFLKQLQRLESFLFNLRGLVAYDYNNHIQDPSHEAIKVDSVTDYLPKGDYIVSDAIMYWQFKKLTHPFVAGTKSDVRLEKLMVQPLTSLFNQYIHNACSLIDHLPESFLQRLHVHEMEEALYLVQMDWLMGTGSGLLFKIREELYGLQNGYEKIFWPELIGRKGQKPTQLSLGLDFNESQIFGHRKAA